MAKDNFLFDEKIGYYPNDWKFTNLKEVGFFYGGGTPSTLEVKYWNGEIVWLVPSDLTSLNESTIFIDDSETKITEKGLKSCSATLLPIGTVCMSSRATIGKVAIARIELCTNQGFINVVGNKCIENIFLLYWIKQFENYISRYAAGTTFLEISKRSFKKLRIALPSNSEQIAIANILRKVDESIEATENSVKAAEKFKKSLIQNLLSGRLKPDGTWRTEDEFQLVKTGKIPSNWRLIKAKDLCVNVTDGTHDTPAPYTPSLSDKGYPLVTSKNLKNGGVDFDGCYLISEKDYVEINKRSKVEQYDILFGMIGTIGNPQIVTQNPVLFAIKNVGLFKLGGNKELSGWIKTFLYSNAFEKYKYGQQAGTTQQYVSLGFLRKIPIPVPSKDGKIDYEEINQIVEKLDKLNSIIKSKKNKVKNLQTLKKSLMQNLLTGKVRIDVEKINKLLEKA